MLKQWSLDSKFNEFIYFCLRQLLSVPVAALQVEKASFFMVRSSWCFSYMSVQSCSFDWGETTVTLLYWKKIQILSPAICTNFYFSLCARTKALYFRFGSLVFCWVFFVGFFFPNRDINHTGRRNCPFCCDGYIPGGGWTHPKCPSLQQWHSWEGRGVGITIWNHRMLWFGLQGTWRSSSPTPCNEQEHLQHLSSPHAQQSRHF